MPSITPELGAVALAGSGATWEWDKRRPTRCQTVVSCGIQSAATARTAELDGQLDEERRQLDEARRQLADTALQLQTARQEVHLRSHTVAAQPLWLCCAGIRLYTSVYDVVQYCHSVHISILRGMPRWGSWYDLVPDMQKQGQNQALIYLFALCASVA